MSKPLMLVTGATGMVGNHVVRRALDGGYRVRILVRSNTSLNSLAGLKVEHVEGDLAHPPSLASVLNDVDVVVHTAAHVGDWGPADKYRAINVLALEHLLTAAEREGRLRRWVQVSSLGVYAGHHHYGTDETVPINVQGLDGYTQTKAEAEVLLAHHISQQQFPAVIVRPGFIYGRGDRHVVPRLVERIRARKMKLIGDGCRVLNNTYVGNLVEAIMLAVENKEAVGQTFNVRDERLVTRKEFVGTIADYLGEPHPRHVPEWIARTLVRPIEGWAHMRGATEAPMLTYGRIKFLTFNLDFSIQKAKTILGYQPKVDFQDGIQETLEDYCSSNLSRQGAVAA